MKKPVKDTKFLFPLWKKYPVINLDRLKYVGMTHKDVDYAMSSLTEFLGGPDVVIPMVKEMMSKTFHAKEGGYDFKFKIFEYKLQADISTGYRILYFDSVDAEVDRQGKVTLYSLEGQPTMTFDELYEKYEDDVDLIWDIGYEITGVIERTLMQEISEKTGVQEPIRSEIDFTFVDSTEFSTPIQENIKKIKRLL
jgi:hypothetical protein